MKQVALRGGQVEVLNVAAPSPAPGRVLVATGASVISTGTERASVESGGGGGSAPVRALRNPELVRQAIAYAREHGLRETIEVARGTRAAASPLGYSAAGAVLDTGGVAAFRPGQLVACAGAGYANHAEVITVPGNLVAPVPDGVSARDAAFATLGAIALQGVRRADPTLGERAVVVGLGLLGALTVQLLRAAGCQVLGVEPQEARRRCASELGAELTVAPAEAPQAVDAWSAGTGADAVIVTASSRHDAVVNSAVSLVRRKGRVVPVGDIGLGLQRGPLYRREADVLISTSYGPGRYDPSYEEQGIDYPLSYVRWTENRNMQEFLRLVSTGQVRVEPLVELEVPVERAGEAYAAVAGERPPLATVLTYDAAKVGEPPREVVRVGAATTPNAHGTIDVALVGVGDFVRGTHLPNLRGDDRARIKLIVSRGGTTAADVAGTLGGADTATDWLVAVEDPSIDLILIGTRHDSHAQIAAAALRAGKAVFVEKPLGLTRAEIDEVWAAGADNDRLAIGFNRPFAPLARRLGDEVAAADGPLHLVYRVNAPLARDHWLNDPVQGGGRILGEACHMFDFANWLCGAPARVQAAALPSLSTVESASVTTGYADGSVATVHYSGAGSGSMPKERVEVLRGGRSWVLDDFTELTSYGEGGPRSETLKRVDKGHAELLRRVLSACRGEAEFEPGLEAAYVAQSVALAALESIAAGEAAAVLLPDRG